MDARFDACFPAYHQHGLKGLTMRIVDTETGKIEYDSAWPVLWVDSFDESLMVSEDVQAWDAGDISADEFKDMWGDFHPDGDWVIGLRPAE
jgi:hypothetical protein